MAAVSWAESRFRVTRYRTQDPWWSVTDPTHGPQQQPWCHVAMLFFGARRDGRWSSTCGHRRCIRPTHLVRGRSKDVLLVRLKTADDAFAEAATWTDEDWYISRDDNPVWDGKLRCGICDDLLSNHTSVFGTCFHQAQANDPRPIASLAVKRAANAFAGFVSDINLGGT